MLLWQIYVAGSNKMHLGFHANGPLLHGNKERSFARGV
jgi:hypothetical protein